MGTFTGDPVKRAFDSRRGLQSAREKTAQSYADTVAVQEKKKAQDRDIVSNEEFFSASHYES